MPNPHLCRESAAILAGCILSITCCTSVLAGNGPAAESVKGGTADSSGVAGDHTSRSPIGTSLRSEAGAFVPPSRAPGGPNEVPGDGTGADHTAFIFAPYYTGENGAIKAGEKDYLKNVGIGGQQYSPFVINSVNCSVLSFYNLIHNNSDKFGTLLITSSGRDGTIGVESFATKVARDDKWDLYVSNTVAGWPHLDNTLLKKDRTGFVFEIHVTDKFVRTYGKDGMDGALVFVATPFGETMNAAFIAAGARVSVGHKNGTNPQHPNSIKKVRETFEAMNGQAGIGKRPIGQAIAGLNLALAGNGATTLAPAIKDYTGPCPLLVGSPVTWEFDTKCDVSEIPLVTSPDATFVVPGTWDASGTKFTAVCATVASPFNYMVTLKWNNAKGKLNDSRLDGNTKPKVNAKGPAHDDYKERIQCDEPCPADVNEDMVTDVADLLLVISSWGDASSGSPADGNQDGVVDIVDLLAVLGVWGDECVYGACCVEGECLAETLVEDCYEYGGYYLGDWETCDSGLCEWGGCCIDGVECLDAYDPMDCISMGGTYAGDGMPCDAMTCVVPVGACCFQDGSCLDSMTDDDCYEADGDFAGFGVSCSEWECTPWDAYGACCFDDPDTGETMCVDFVIESDCGSFGPGVFHLGASCYEIQCNVHGACCIDEGGLYACTDDITQDECIATGGTFHPFTSCDYLYVIEACGGLPDDYGACCLPYGDCMPYGSAESCSALGGQFAGAGVACDEVDCQPWSHVGACCIIDPVDGTAMCMESIQDDECSSMAGVFHADTACVDVVCGFGGACCIELSDGSLTCVDGLDFDSCTIDSDGAFHPGMFCGEFECELLGACCIDVDNTPSCMDQVSIVDCDSAGGEFSPKVTCEYVYDTGECGEFEEHFGACCVEMEGIPFCYESVDEWSCQLEGGMFHLGLTCDEIGCGW